MDAEHDTHTQEGLRPCHRKAAFTRPIPGTPGTEQALRTCQTCPFITQCAKEALTAGDSTDGHVTRPAMDVIQAGIHCHGDQITAWRLSRIAGVEMPTVSDTTPRNAPPPYCRGCKRAMHKWTRGTVPGGYVLHHGRGWCTNCRSSYRAELEAAKLAEAPTHYDSGRTRSRHDQPHPAPTQPEPEQLPLFAT